MIKTISSLMETPLPSKRKQKKLVFKPTRELAYEVYTALNHIVFNNTLNQNPQILYRSLVRYWGQCVQYDCNDTLSCKILLDRRFYCAQWFTTILAHEMCHAYEWEVMKLKLTPDEEHKEYFFVFKEPLAQLGIPLRECYDVTEWFKTQDMLRT